MVIRAQTGKPKTRKASRRLAMVALALAALIGLTAAAALAAPPPPSANFTFSPRTPMTGQSVAFDASSSSAGSGKIASYAWDFGDGTSAATVRATHAYPKPGTYEVSLTVTDNNGSTGKLTQAVQVTAPAVVPTATLGSSGRIPVRSGIAQFNVLCAAGEPSMCQGTLTLVTASKVAVPGRHRSRRKLVLGSAVYTIDPGASEQVGVHLSAAGRKLLAHGRRLRVVVRLVDNGTTQDSAGKTATTAATVTL